MNNVGKISVRRLVQWTSSADSDRLRVNDAYPRAGPEWTLTDKGKFLHEVLLGTDVSVLIFNVTESDSYIVDGASRISALVDFQQGKIPMVVAYTDMPDRISYRPYGVSPEQYKREQFRFEADTLVEAYYSGFQPDQKRAFLQANVDMRRLSNMSTEDEKNVYWRANFLCPSSPSYQSHYDEAETYVDVALRLKEQHRPRLAHILHLIGGVHRELACAEVLLFARDILSYNQSAPVDSVDSRDGPRNPSLAP
jgi:hypothetical protein